MLGSHNSFTYLNAQNIFIKMFHYFWRCQKLTLQEQYDKGVRFFDIRVIYEKNNENEYWKVSHGMAKLDQTFNDLKSICVYFKKQFKGSKIRIILEREADNEYIIEKFKSEASKLTKTYLSIVTYIIIKNPWEHIYSNNEFTEIKDYCCHLFNWNLEKSIIDNLKEFDITSWSIKLWSKKHNPKEITKEMIDDPNILYFMDYIGIYPKL